MKWPEGLQIPPEPLAAGTPDVLTAQSLDRSAYEQARIRAIIVSLGSYYLSVLLALGHDGGRFWTFATVVLAADVVAWGLLRAHSCTDFRQRFREGLRYAGIVYDMATVTAAFLAGGVHVAALFFVYLWVPIGNALRFGPRHLYVSQALAVSGWLCVTMMHPFWHSAPALSFGLLATIVAIPIYAGVLANRLHNANHELRRLHTDLEHAATHDSLTGLPNRRRFLESLHTALYTAERYQRPFSLLLIDLNDFKKVNDHEGHLAGDELLRITASRLEASVRRTDLVARFGGDEFVILLRETPGPTATHVAHLVLDRLAEPSGYPQWNLPIRCSLGIATWPQHGRTVRDLIEHADAAMYAAKARCDHGYAMHGATPVAVAAPAT